MYLWRSRPGEHARRIRYRWTDRRPAQRRKRALVDGKRLTRIEHLNVGPPVGGTAFRVLTVVDNWSRESVLLETGFRLTGEHVARALAEVAKTRSLPRSITVDHGTEFTSKALDEWAWENGLQLDFTRPGTPRIMGSVSLSTAGSATNA